MRVDDVATTNCGDLTERLSTTSGEECPHSWCPVKAAELEQYAGSTPERTSVFDGTD
jgi:hypothetical protein